ncbi:MAG: YfhO family protein, partial [Xanthomarina sp.]
LAVLLAIGLNATNILATQEYAKESTRGQSELTINPDGSPKEITAGLDREYITEYSYGILETFNLFIPRFLGGGSHEDVGKDSESYQFFLKQGIPPLEAIEYAKQTPTYWGKQTIVEAPAYVGAVVIFLFVFALFLVKGRLKWWLVGGSLLSLILSYGDSQPFKFITDFFIDYIPFYNKFRAVSSTQVILELCIPVLAIIGLSKLFQNVNKEEEKLKALKFTVIITAGLALIFLVFKSSFFNFVGGSDGFYRQNYGPQFMDALIADRKSFFTQDTLRTLILVLLAGGGIYLFLKKKLSETKVIIAFALLILIDLVGVDRRYVNNDAFVPLIRMNKPYQATEVDQAIMQDPENFRVFDLVSRAPAKASYFHNSLSGYHAAKLKRYDELFDFYISKNNINVLNMLNTKYIIAEDEEGNPFPYTNPDANGNAWFVENIKFVNSANDELLALDSLDNKRVAVMMADTDYASFLMEDIMMDTTASIKVETYQPNYIKYKSLSAVDGFAVFSEIYYKNGWNAYIDGELTPHARVNYVLRGMHVPAGKHEIEFKFEPQVIKTGSTIALASSILFVLLLFGGLFYNFKKEKE